MYFSDPTFGGFSYWRQLAGEQLRLSHRRCKMPFLLGLAPRVFDALCLSAWSAEAVVHMKRGCKAKVSYKFLCKRLERLGLIVSDQFDRIQFQKLEERMFGVPFYRRRHAS
jgi:hypothetical protein